MGRGCKEEDFSVITQSYPEWLYTKVPDEYEDADLLKIIMFFVINSPCEGQSKRGIPLTTYGWKSKPWYSDSYLKDKLDKIIFGDGEKIFCFANCKKELEQKIRNNDFKDDFYCHRDNQRIAIAKVNQKNCGNKYMSLFYHIRNSFAHGRLAMYPAKDNDIMFVMEDGIDIDKERFGVSARIVILKSSLLNIIERLTTPPEEENNFEDDVILSIKNEKNTKKKIMQELEMDDRTYNKTIGSLKEKGKIKFDKECWNIVG